MRKKEKKRSWWGIATAVTLAAYSAFTLLDAFVIPKNVISAEAVTQTVYAGTGEEDDGTASGSVSNVEKNASDSSNDSEIVITDNSYTSDDVEITITEMTVDDSRVYVADIQLSDPSLLLSGLADNSFGQNVTETTSEIASDVGAILAINGDFYGFRDSGYVMRNGYLYRSTGGGDQEDLVVYSDGTMEIINESDVTAEELQAAGATQIYSFGPGLVDDGEIIVGPNDEVDQAMTSNPRTAIGQISDGHYVCVVSDGRTNESEGLTLYQLASVMQDLGCTVAYNLDGGGSSTMVFNGEVINNPTSGHGIKERSVSDIVYIQG